MEKIYRQYRTFWVLLFTKVLSLFSLLFFSPLSNEEEQVWGLVKVDIGRFT
jgi:hypothetical protein